MDHLEWSMSNMVHMFSTRFWCISWAAVGLITGSALLSTSASAQASNAPHAAITSADTGQKKEVKFEVVSIHPLKSGSAPTGTGFTPNPTPDGFVSTLTVWQMLMVAYAPGNLESWLSTPLVNEPKWFGDTDWYVVTARVSDADRDAWRNQSNHHELLRSAMQDLLKVRCKLVVHEQSTEIPDFKLVVSKKGPKGLKPTVPGSALPKGTPLPTGGVMVSDGPRLRPTWHFYGVTIGELVDFLSRSSQARLVHDATGLTGRYDFAIQMIETPSREPEEEVYNWPIEPLGLELKPGKSQGFTLVIDHMEKPTPN